MADLRAHAVTRRQVLVTPSAPALNCPHGGNDLRVGRYVLQRHVRGFQCQ